MIGEFCKTLPELAKEASKAPYGGVTNRPRKMNGYLILPDGNRFWLGKIEVSIDGYGDGLITNCNLNIKAESFSKTEEGADA